MIFKKYITEKTEKYTEGKLILEESLDDMDRRCEVCDTLLNDMGTCPKCAEGEEDYGDNDLDEQVKDTVCSDSANCSVASEEQESLKEEATRQKLIKAFPGVFSFDPTFKPSTETSVDSNEQIVEDLSNKQKLEKAFPDVHFDWQDSSTEVLEGVQEEYFDYDDDPDVDDVEADRLHSALYGGDRMYCDCGEKLVMDEWGGYCPVCDAEEVEKSRQLNMLDDVADND